MEITNINTVYLYLGGGVLVVLLLVFLFKSNVVSVLTKGKWVLKTQEENSNKVVIKGNKNKSEQLNGQNEANIDGDENINKQGKK
jgi:hypothetical protein